MPETRLRGLGLAAIGRLRPLRGASRSVPARFLFPRPRARISRMDAHAQGEAFTLLRSMHLFRGLTEADFAELLDALQPAAYPANEVIYREGEEGDLFYIVQDGGVEVLITDLGEEPVMTLSPGDYFGDVSMLHPDELRPVTMRAITPVKLLTLDHDNFEVLLIRFPQIKPYLEHSPESRGFYAGHSFRWIAPNEKIVLATQRHWLVLIQKIALPGLLALVLLSAAGVAGLAFNTPALALTMLGLGLIPLLAWMGWGYLDWGNDYFIVTNQRIVYLEKIIGIYESRQESPLTSLRSVRVEAPDVIARQLDLGNVIVGTFSGPIIMRSAPHAEGLAEIIKEQAERARSSTYRSKQAVMEDAIRRRIRPAPPAPPTAAPPGELRERERERPPGIPLFNVRFEQGDSITYRKHWYVLVREIWKPSGLIIVALALIGIRAGGLILWPWASIWLVVVIALIPLILWWLYEFVDWQNDIYQVTPDKILDIHRKPLGAESRKEAPLDNVLSLKYERPGLLGILLNYGTVTAKVATEDFKFEGVYDPVSVQNDVYRRLEARHAAREKAEGERRRGEIVEWFEVYHKVANELPKP